ncbi:MAG: hypothetical protein LAQ30_24645, partial [Acidobacteriia bacterium]|nr:hypothetical protein [Terriglobia bacterium]
MNTDKAKHIFVFLSVFIRVHPWPKGFFVMEFSRQTREDLFSQVADAARVQGVSEIETIVTGGAHALTRFAN